MDNVIPDPSPVVSEQENGAKSSGNSTNQDSPPSDFHKGQGNPAEEHMSSNGQAANSDLSIQINVVVGHPAPRQRGLLSSREERMKSLKDSLPHNMKLMYLNKEEKQFEKERSGHTKLIRDYTKDLYMILSWYALLESGIFASVSQTTIYSCNDCWGPVLLVFLVMIGTVIATIEKLMRLSEEHEKVIMSRARKNAVFDAIENMRVFGSDCDINNLDISCDPDVDSSRPYCLCSSYGLLVLGFLVGFSILVAVSCVAMLCDNRCSCK
ncbi:hypothetical protein KP509_13G076900 [Ceratopteris richardii]|nr:hypothetical protein KP509_13G076900 [Ceratopteris richardii]